MALPYRSDSGNRSVEPGPASSPDANRLQETEPRGRLDGLGLHGVVVWALIGLLVVVSIWALLLMMM